LDLHITDFKIVDDGFFSINYGKFKIEVPEFGWSVWRRYNDFEWLR